MRNTALIKCFNVEKNTFLVSNDTTNTTCQDYNDKTIQDTVLFHFQIT
jgi:hypothetical protein